MKICAIICEYNPLHFGHMEHIKISKEKSGADAIMCIMAGNFSQRGEPTLFNKYVRAKMAIEAGADIVVQIPTAYACSSAEIFALAGVKIANSFESWRGFISPSTSMVSPGSSQIYIPLFA